MSATQAFDLTASCWKVRLFAREFTRTSLTRWFKILAKKLISKGLLSKCMCCGPEALCMLTKAARNNVLY